MREIKESLSLDCCSPAPALLAKLLDHLADQIAEYAIFQASSGADYVMLFDSWAAQLPPKVEILSWQLDR